MPEKKSKMPIVVLSIVNLFLVLAVQGLKIVPFYTGSHPSGNQPGTELLVFAGVSVGCALLFVIFCLLINKAPGLNFIPEAILIAYDIGYQVYRSLEYGSMNMDFFVYGIIFAGFVIVYGLAMTGKFGYSVAGRVLIIIFGVLRLAYVILNSIRFGAEIMNMTPTAAVSYVLNTIRGILIVITIIMCVFHAAKRKPKAA